MSKKIVLRFTLKELSDLIQDEKSRVILQRCIRKIPLQPYCLNDLRGSIHEDLDANLAKFDHELKGLLLSYKNVKIVKNVANMLHDDSRLYVTIQADFYLFMPEVGRVLRGVVNKKSADHIGCLVHKAFNVSIPRPACDSHGDWKGYYVEIGQEVTFQVESLDLTGSLPYMVGCLLDLGSVPSPASPKFSEENISESLFDGESLGKHTGFQEPLDDLEASLVERKKKKKHKKNAEYESTSELSFTECRSSDGILEMEKYHGNKICKENNVDSSVLKASKKKKRKYAEHCETIKQEEQVYNRGDEEQSINGPDPCVEQEVIGSKKDIDGASLNNVYNGATEKKKKRKYSEVFQEDKLDYQEPILMSQDDSWTSFKPKKRKKLLSEMSFAYEEGNSIHTSQITTEDKNKNNKKGRLVEEQFRAEAEYQDIDTSHDTSQEKKRKKKEKLVKGMNYAESEDHSIDTLEEGTKGKKKKKKEKLLAEMSNFESENHDIDISQEVTHEKTKKKKSKKKNSEGLGDEKIFDVTDVPSYSISHSQDISNMSDKMESETLLDREYRKKVSKKKKSDIATSTPIENRSLKVSKTSCKLAGTSNITQLQLSHVETERLKNEREIETYAQSLKVKPLKKENKVCYLETENSCGMPLSSLQRRENKKEHHVEKCSHYQVKNTFEQSLKSKSKLNNKESATVMLKKEDIAHTRSTVQENSNVNPGVRDYQNDSSDSDNRHQNVHIHPGKLKPEQELNRISETVTDMKKHKVHDVNFKGKNDNGNRSSSEKSGKQNENTVISRSYSQTLQNLDRAYSSDSGLSLSVTSCERESGISATSGRKREVSSPCSRRSSEDSIKHVKPVKTPKTSKIKGISSPEGNSGLYAAKKIKKERETPVKNPSSSQQSNEVGSSVDDDSLEAARMKLLAAVVKRLDGGNEKGSTRKHEHPTHRENEEALLGTDGHPSPSSKIIQKRKRNNKEGSVKNIVQEPDTANQSADFHRKGSGMRITNPLVPSPLTNQVPIPGSAKIESNLNCEKEYSPARLQTKVSGRTPKRKSVPGVEDNKVKSTLKKEPKIKVEKESRKTSKTSASSNTQDLKSLQEETPDAIADRLLQEFIKRKSIS